MFRIKICGVTREADALHAINAGADALGLNFYAKSSRCVGVDQARVIASAIGTRAKRVGVFVNAPAEEIGSLVASVPLDAVQLHGDEPAEFVAELPPDVPIIRACRVGPEGLAPVARQLEAADGLGRPFAAVLLDAAAGPGVYGGSGHAADWERIAQERPLLGDTPVILAGGLTPANVAAAIQATGVDGVDTASGVEASAGRKDARLIDEFVFAASAALNEGGAFG